MSAKSMPMVELSDYVDTAHSPLWGQLVEFYNRIGRGDVDKSNVENFRSEYDTKIEAETRERKQKLEQAGLSEREAEVVALKEEGFTNSAIMTYLELGSQSTVDEYARRAREKYKRAEELVGVLADSPFTE